MAARLTSIACIALGVFLYWAARGSDYPLAYYFPQMLGVLMAVLGAAMLVMELGANRKPATAAVDIPWARLWPGILVLVTYMAVAQTLGFYLSSWLAFASIGILYAPGRGLATARRCVPISAVFLGVLYLVFWTLLRVQMPRGFAF
jgi:hypothetical protein